ncbi:Dipeptide and tripeptide permease A [Anaerohalosphaera lusitana]|uniref:Dipeptide and tripeptide permease A n=1 Tax=Anaerohalosphaera lusitana TaxID=1936003 RepID=A0A1U9NJ93_9BACT|nr:MFS transporter [Anaerohalosphaera lusitana]AQT67991.1 Dipeptide and tripeptide permease A [Anaerohalosphaera lusitana]
MGDSAVENAGAGRMPGAVPHILMNKTGERFAFYGIRTILVVYMTRYLLDASGEAAPMGEEQAKSVFHYFTAAAYFLPVVGAVLSDALLGMFRTIVVFSLFYSAGALLLAVDGTRTGLYAAMVLLAVGSGVIKPCLSANVGEQFDKSNEHLMSRVYGWFYFAINVGAIGSMALTPWLLERFGPGLAFGVPAACMIVAMAAIWVGRGKMKRGEGAGMDFVRQILRWDTVRGVGHVFVIFLFVAVFWALFDQTSSAWILQAEKMDRRWLGVEFLPSQMPAVNAGLVMAGIPLFNYVVYPAMGKIFKLTALRKMGVGFFVTAGAFAISAMIERAIGAGAEVSIGWQVLAYVVLTAGEIMVSITAMEFSYTQAPREMKSFMMSIYFLSISLGNVFTAGVNTFIQNADGTSKLAGAEYYWFFAAVMAVAAVVFVPVARAYRR